MGPEMVPLVAVVAWLPLLFKLSGVITTKTNVKLVMLQKKKQNKGKKIPLVCMGPETVLLVAEVAWLPSLFKIPGVTSIEMNEKLVMLHKKQKKR